MTQRFNLKHLLSVVVIVAIFNVKADDFETVRMKSTAGAGVGAILMDEATLLNPAPLAFFDVTALYFQLGKSDIMVDDSPFGASKANLTSFIISDAGGHFKGSISYQAQVEGEHSKDRYSISIAAPMGEVSSMGVTYRHTKEVLKFDTYDEKSTYDQFTLGIFHALKPQFTIGLLLIDPFKKVPTDTKVILGMQYNYENFLTLMGDVGANYDEDLGNTLLLRAALQVKILEDFYLRFGTFSDKVEESNGNGFGVGWIQPKLVINFAIKNSKFYNYADTLSIKRKKESSFSLAYRF
ncbi:MAG: hypothetical protein ISR65_04010 [Bacteriovoracaceae bacterium]|nr:hypothetical protein [Bacteriovoracaceae bacterium]